MKLLQEKTAGNLTPEEGEYLSNILRDLRMEYVAVLGKNEKESGGEKDSQDHVAGAPGPD